MFSYKAKAIHVENGVNILFIIPIIITVQGLMSEIYTMVSDLHENVHLVWGVKIS